MSDQSSIEWTDATWNPVRGCVKVSPGCAHCYAETFAERFRGVPGHPYEQGFDLRLVPEKLREPLAWKKPRRVFVNSMSDLFQDGVPGYYIDQVFAIMALTPQHTYQVLTKRAERMRAYVNGFGERFSPQTILTSTAWRMGLNASASFEQLVFVEWPLPNVWLGVSVENQHFADERIPLLLQTPAAVRFISAEPLLGPVDISNYVARLHTFAAAADRAADDLFVTTDEAEAAKRDYKRLDWVIVGGESGPGARPFDVAWARSIVSQCRQAGVPCFVKQLGAAPMRSRTELAAGAGVECEHGYDVCPTCDAGTFPLKLRSKKGGDPAEWPADLRVREFPAPGAAIPRRR